MHNNIENNLASYALKSKDSKGREYKEEIPKLRTEFQRDRERIIHSTAFRRLEYKTQVFVNHEGDMYRTRLTHTIEVAQISRAASRALMLNEDLTEAISLAHDLGHTPFGHAGQDILNKCMKDFGGFEHNIQSLRVIEKLENKYASFSGLNLCFETREGILKKCSKTRAKDLGEVGRRFIDKKQSSLEAQLTNVCDEIAYNNHDIQDGVKAKKIFIEQLETLPIFFNQMKIVLKKYPKLSGSKIINETVRLIINLLINDLIRNSNENIINKKIINSDDVRNCDSLVIGFSDEIKMLNMELKRFLYSNLYKHPDVIKMTDQANLVIENLFSAYMNDIKLIPNDYIQYNLLKINSGFKERVICDYIAGMTDRFAQLEYTKIFNERS
ncbi:MAG: deoxyguanosinetriphosphate triphosphohydrolase [Gammaproteobacteria bacterium]|jgi:dGTPase|nr:deoxyguanosinetriphosphate triphosphohydrolase [Gammaproteobacteria bacterium]MBT7522871.1 deoxyguanosinetriphosphate triphosphohydrolase [Gammaproteobacteria bacterium]MDC3386034.1 deoxyguanosinetriphosphate triphosphohydrolase [Gammaproteobacteria bacterium]